MIPEATLQQIQDRLDIVEIISNHVVLKRSGRNFKACCPFHQEKTPSFMVNQDKQIFHCFGCGAGGNIFGFVMKIEKKDFPEAVETLADRAGIEIPKDRVVNTAAAERASQVIKANALAADFYRKFLLERKEAERARQYLKKRGLSADTIEKFRLGFAPETWDALCNELGKQLPQSVLEKSGLVIAKKEGGFYDRFRNRVIFPILDGKGNCVAFGGRVMDDALPKYLNSPETEVYSKGRNLYGYYQAVRPIRDNDLVIVVEGYMDLIICHQAGVENVVASLGTALTNEQARLVKRSTKNVVMLYDADKAGETATLRGLEIFLEEGMDVKIVRLPEGHDPDSFILERGIEAFHKELAAAKTLFDYKLSLLKQKFDFKTIEGKVKIANDMVALFSKVQNEILKSGWTKELAKELSLSEEALVQEMKKSGRVRAAASEAPAAPVKSVEAKPAEKILIGLMLNHPGAAKRVHEEIGLDEFQSPSARKIAEVIFGSAEVPAASALINFFREDAETANFISAASAEAANLADEGKVLADCLVQIRRQRIRTDREELMSRIAQAERSGDENRVKKFMSEISELNKKERTINEKK